MFLPQIGGNPCRAVTHDLKNFEFSHTDKRSKDLARQVIDAWKNAQGVRNGPRTIHGACQYQEWQAKRRKSCTSHDTLNQGSWESKGKLMKRRVEKEGEMKQENIFIESSRSKNALRNEEVERLQGLSSKDGVSTSKEDSGMMWQKLRTIKDEGEQYKEKYNKLKGKFVQSRRVKLEEEERMKEEWKEIHEARAKVERETTVMQKELPNAYDEINHLKRTITFLEKANVSIEISSSSSTSSKYWCRPTMIKKSLFKQYECKTNSLLKSSPWIIYNNLFEHKGNFFCFFSFPPDCTRS